MTPCCAAPKTLSQDVPPSRRRLIVYAGPTGGHLFPAQSFAEGFRQSFPEFRIELVTSRRAEALTLKMPAGTFDAVRFLPDFGFPVRLSWGTFKPFFLAPYLFVRSFLELVRDRPVLCVGFASFVSYPGMMTAHWLGIPTMVHEQNVVPGKATQWLVPYMDVVVESFAGTKFRPGIRELHTAGLPLRSMMSRALNEPLPKKGPQRLTLLVVGGSQGAKGLNEAVVGAMEELSREERDKIAVIHITGKQDQAWVSGRYKVLELRAEVHPFCGDMDRIFRRADLAVTRAGANTLFELAFFGVPALVIPYPHAGGHQKYNAEAFAERGGLFYHEEGPTAKEWLLRQLQKFLKDPGQLIPMADAMRSLAKPRATETLVKLAGKWISRP
ncbi:MAG TPA: UDP-N-acetylglucosamine--N-acetylmuramyl-(pentapeptide) pyrophosphoryl-undecaprenol N-acetylglucosamine transferase [Candidatus Omnitrophota bacterium]|nr:UDP-N-acetylglucosamine--N-acetylmuramyl-(pentapeptide) pyrophosphoryl-undecaprenol N-acetylglucosamine transferase [Candidatus Omnitrophota bacterium]HPS36755.1 UDP-N-acetylglucosamine--N-acetylmuramyl-(pentapeptide) pyrophosphoryl-undecaprenol N-acetylglucosamine transferase [Candidatus Omnitrophota bacterium]